MGSRDQTLLQKLLAIFKIEAEEHLTAISSGLLELEKAASVNERMEIIERVFREAHTLKGAARAVNLTAVESACQSLESVFAELKTHESELTVEHFDGFHQAVDGIAALLSDSKAEHPAATKSQDRAEIKSSEPPSKEGTPALKSGASAVTVSSENLQPPIPPAGHSSRPAAPQRPSETLRIPVSKLDLLFRQAEELTPTKATAAQRVVELQEIGQALALWEADWRKLRPNIRSVQRSMKNGSNGHKKPENGQAAFQSDVTNLLSFVDRTCTTFRGLQGRVALLGKHLDEDRRAFERRLDDLLEDAKQVSTIPFSTLLELFPKLVRDLCRDCNKDAELIVTGSEIEADRRILEEIKDPLVHLIRNSVDHGIEPVRTREESGKPPRATIAIGIATKNADKLEIVVSDDGAGIDLGKVRTAAVKLGIASQDDAETMEGQEVAALIFKSGISTSPIITEVSGRGLGLAIVREKVEKVGGSVAVETRRGQGTSFRLTLPLTVARFRGTVVRVADRLLVVPTRHIEKVFRVSLNEIRSAENREMVQSGGRPLSLVRLGDVLGITRTTSGLDSKHQAPVLLLAWAGERIAFLVDEILDDQEVLVKSLGKQLLRVRNVSGATVLATGKVLPVLNVGDLMRSAVRAARPTSPVQSEQAPNSVLVAEDSITARTLLRNILETAGYKVKTAVDGAEALTVLANEDFDLVVSDVEMPRLSGFDLTAKIRSDKRLSSLPVVLVTALASREDQERGVEVGANAYIVKSSFDQTNLLEVVRSLI